MISSQTGSAKSKAVCRSQQITMSHGSGGKDMRDLIEDIFVGGFGSPELSVLEDQARLDIAELARLGNRLAFTTDSYVVDPIFFPGGNIGTLAVNGTVNDLCVSGAQPLYLSCGFILEEGFSVSELREIVASMKAAAERAGVKIVTGDTKVVERGAADKIFINTAGIGVISSDLQVAAGNIKPGDLVIVNGTIGDHGAAIVGVREELGLENNIQSDCQSLHSLVRDMVATAPSSIHAMRDGTRGGVATVLNEFAEAANVCIRVKESELPVAGAVRGLCEILGLDPLYLANEGKLLAVVAPDQAQAVLESMRRNESGKQARVIGEVTAAPQSTVILDTTFGAQRMLDKLLGEQLPRIC